MASLYEINSQIESWEPEVDQETGEILNGLDWDALQMARETKLENIGCYIKNLTADIAAFKTEEKALADRRKSAERKVDYLKNLLMNNMPVDEKFSTAKCAISFRKSESVEILDESIVPKKFLVKTVSFRPDKTAIKELLKAGSKVKGCILASKQNVQVK